MMFSLAQPSEKSAQLRLMPSAPRRTDLRNNAPFFNLLYTGGVWVLKSLFGDEWLFLWI